MAKTIPEAEITFHKLLQVLADQCGYHLTEVTIALYDEALAPLGYEKANHALKEIFNSRRGGDRFPSVADIKDKLGINVSRKALAIEATNLIFWAFANWKLKFCAREDFEQQFKEKIGPLPWEVVYCMGGYEEIYDEFMSGRDPAALRAQIRETAMAVLELHKADDCYQVEGKTPHQLGGKNGESDK